MLRAPDPLLGLLDGKLAARHGLPDRYLLFADILSHALSASQAANVPTLVPLPSWLTIPNLPLNLCTLGALLWGGLYVLLEPVAGTALALLCLGAAAAGNYLIANYNAHTITTYAAATHIASWILQFIGHGAFEGRAPALLDNLFQAIFLAPLFVWLELLFAFGYRQELQGRVERRVQKEIAKFRASRETTMKSKAQ